MNKKHDFDVSALTTAEIQSEWERLTEEQKRPFVIAAEAELNRAPHLQDEIKAILQKTRGSITWRQMATHLRVQYAPRKEEKKTKLKPNKACVLLHAQDLIAQSLVSSSK